LVLNDEYLIVSDNTGKYLYIFVEGDPAGQHVVELTGISDIYGLLG
jgi:hypothetical protein